MARMSRTIGGAISIFAIVLAAAPATLAISPGAAPTPGGIFVADQSAAGGSGAVIRIDPANGAQTSLTAVGLLAAPVGIAVVPR